MEADPLEGMKFKPHVGRGHGYPSPGMLLFLTRWSWKGPRVTLDFTITGKIEAFLIWDTMIRQKY